MACSKLKGFIVMRFLRPMAVAVVIAGSPVTEAQGLVAKAKASRAAFAQRMFLQETIFEMRGKSCPTLVSAMSSGELRCEVRAQLITDLKCAVVASRREMGEALTEARARASEQARKFAAEMKEVTRARGRRAEF